MKRVAAFLAAGALVLLAACEAYFPPIYPSFLQVTPLKTSYAAGEVFDPGSAAAVYRQDADKGVKLLSFAAGEFKVTLTAPSGGAVTLSSGTHTLGADGGWTVTVQAGDLNAGPYTITVNPGSDPGEDPGKDPGKEPEPGADILSFFYADHPVGDPNPDGRMRRNAEGAYLIDGTAPQGKLIHRVIPLDPDSGQPFPGKTYLLGRMDNEAVILNIDPDSGDISFQSAYSGGTYNGFIPIGSVEELTMIGMEYPAGSGTFPNLNGKYLLTANIDLLGSAASPHHWTPIGNDLYTFNGVFDGGGKTISGLNIPSGGDQTGLFGVMHGGATVRNLIVAGSVTGGANTGGVAGELRNSAGIVNCENRVSVTGGGENTGGVAGFVDSGGFLTDCSNSGRVTSAYSNTGGVAGELRTSAKIENCENRSSVTSSGQNTGGVAGRVTDGAFLKNCRNTGSVTSTYKKQAALPGDDGDTDPGNTGGVAGSVDDGAFFQTGCSNSGDVISASSNTGGVAGFVELPDDGSLTNCSNSGFVYSKGISIFYNRPVNETTDLQYYADNTGGVAGKIVLAPGAASATVSDCSNSGWVESDSFYYGFAGGTLKLLGSRNAGGVAGLVRGAEITVRNCYNYGTLAGCRATGRYSGGVAGNIDGAVLSVCENKGAVNANDGSGGLAGIVQNNGKIENCVNWGTIQCHGGETSGIAGVVDNGTISNCSNYGHVTNGNSSGHDTGGVAGIVQNSGVVENCSNYGWVDTTFNNVGGIAGKLDTGAVVRNSTNYGLVTGANGPHYFADAVGGVAGIQASGTTITGCRWKSGFTAPDSTYKVALHGIADAGGSPSNTEAAPF